MLDYYALLAGAATAVLTFVSFLVFLYVKKAAANRKFKRYLAQVTEEGHKKIMEASREVGELSFRDKSGGLCVVKIVVDHNLPDHLMDAFKAADASGNLQDIMSGHKVSEDAMGQVEEFIFSPRAVRDMRAAGIEPDEVVRQMLRAAGRIT